MLTSLLLAVTLAAAPAPQSDLDRAWEQVQMGAQILQLAEDQRPTIARANREEAAEAEALVNNAREARESADRLVDDIMVDVVEEPASSMAYASPIDGGAQ